MPWAAEFLTDTECADQRRAPRRSLHLAVVTNLPSEGASVIIHNLSRTGLLIETADKLEAGETFDVALPEVGATEVRVAWTSGDFYGCEFLTPISTGGVSAALLRALHASTATPEPEPTPLSRQAAGYGSARQDDLADQSRIGPKLPIHSRLLIILGISLALWVSVALLIWAAFF